MFLNKISIKILICIIFSSNIVFGMLRRQTTKITSPVAQQVAARLPLVTRYAPITSAQLTQFAEQGQRLEQPILETRKLEPVYMSEIEVLEPIAPIELAKISRKNYFGHSGSGVFKATSSRLYRQEYPRSIEEDQLSNEQKNDSKHTKSGQKSTEEIRNDKLAAIEEELLKAKQTRENEYKLAEEEFQRAEKEAKIDVKKILDNASEERKKQYRAAEERYNKAGIIRKYSTAAYNRNLEERAADEAYFNKFHEMRERYLQPFNEKSRKELEADKKYQKLLRDKAIEKAEIFWGK